METQQRNPLIRQRSISAELKPSPELNFKLREKLVGLSGWRINHSAIQFSEGGVVFKGGFASVSRASLLDAESGQEGQDPGDVAVKKINIESIEKREKVLGLALREAQFLVELSHDNIIELRGFVEDISNDQIWLVFPWASNGNLRDFIALADWEVPERIWLIHDVINALEYLHTRDPPIYHGDLKSVNILVDSERSAVLTDFGSARRVQPKGMTVDEKPSRFGRTAGDTENAFKATVDELANTLTLTGNKFTLRWAAPELLEDDEAGIEADIWAFGWVCYEVMTGRIPFSDLVKDSAITVRIFKGHLPSLDDHVRMSLMRSLGSLMVSCWSMTPGQRSTANTCRKTIDWLPMCAPRSLQSLGTGIAEATLFLWLGRMYLDQSNTEKAVEGYTEALHTAREAKDVRLQTQASRGLADVHRMRGEHAISLKLYEESLQICEETGDRRGKADALSGIASIHRMQDEYAEAIPLYAECLQIHEETGDRSGKACVLWRLADAHRLREEYANAIPLYEESLQISEEIGHRMGKANALWGLANIHQMHYECAKAIPLYEDSLQICEEIGDRIGKADALSGIASIHRMQDKYAEAIPLYAECLQIREETGDRSGKAGALWELADSHRMRDEYANAIPLYEESLQIFEEIGDRRGKANALWGLAHIHQMQHEYAKAIPLYENSLQICEEIGDRSGEADALSGLANSFSRFGDVHADRREYTDAVKMYRCAACAFERIELPAQALEASDKADAIQMQLSLASNP